VNYDTKFSAISMKRFQPTFVFVSIQINIPVTLIYYFYFPKLIAKTYPILLIERKFNYPSSGANGKETQKRRFIGNHNALFDALTDRFSTKL